MKKAAITLFMLATFNYLYSANIKDMAKIKDLSTGRFVVDHGMRFTKEYSTWCGIINRCHNPKSKEFVRYGKRGIEVYPQWRKSFICFFNDVGKAHSPKHTLDRIENNGNYEPGNVRWATYKVQENNRSNNNRLTFNGKTQTLTMWCEELGLSVSTIHHRLVKGWSHEKALTHPVDKRFNSSKSNKLRNESNKRRRNHRLSS